MTSGAALKAINRAIGAKTTEEVLKEIDVDITKTENEQNTKEFNGQAYNVYRVTKENYFSKITVTAFVRKGKLIEVKIDSKEKIKGSDLLTDEIREEWARAILESKSADPDAISGATLKFSASSVMDAMIEILAKIGERIE